MKKGRLFIISAPSGAGKTTILKPVLKDLSAISFSISHTTRQPRSNEQDGIDYHFVDKKDFEKIKEENGFLEWAEVHGNFYGTSKEMVSRQLASGTDVILDIDIQGARQIKHDKLFTADFIFIAPPSLEELKRRLEGRKTETKESLNTRLHNAKQELEAAGMYDYIIINDKIEDAIVSLKSIIIEKRIGSGRNIAGNAINLNF